MAAKTKPSLFTKPVELAKMLIQTPSKHIQTRTFVTTAWSMMSFLGSDGFRYASGLSQHSLDIIIIYSRFEGALMHAWVDCNVELGSSAVLAGMPFGIPRFPLGARYQSSNTQQFFQTGWNADPGIQKNQVQCLQPLGISWALMLVVAICCHLESKLGNLSLRVLAAVVDLSR